MTYGKNPASISRTAFECPHCGAYTTQTWFDCLANKLGEGKSPNRPTKTFLAEWKDNTEKKVPDGILLWLERRAEGEVFLERREEMAYAYYDANNVNLSECFDCKKTSVGLHDSVVWPARGEGPPAHAETPSHIRTNYDEARSIAGLSAKGAAALLRLCVQQLCDHLGHEAQTIDKAIAAMVADGLPKVVQEALDSVRVIGNEAVHPGTMDIGDDPATAEKLFGLVNFIVERMIGEPKRINEIYLTLPETKRKAIEARDEKKKKD